MDYLVKIRSVQTPLNGQFSIGANNQAPAFAGAISLPYSIHLGCSKKDSK